MRVYFVLTLLVIAALPMRADADSEPARGKLLVATELVRGADFEQSVVLLLHYDDNGALGLIVNRSTAVHPGEALPDLEDIERYDGKIYYGGPVETHALSALMRTGDPPDSSKQIVGDIYIVPIDEGTIDGAASDETLRFYIGYAGWAPRQLDDELAQGSWHIVAATEEHVFAPVDREIWRELIPPPTLRVKLDSRPVSSRRILDLVFETRLQ